MHEVAVGILLAYGIAAGVYLMTSTSNSDDDDWQRLRDARQTVLEGVFGPADDILLHSPVPFYLDGAADVLMFHKHNNGVVYVTADLIGDDRSRPNELGQYELMICTPGDSEWAPQLISNLARYTIDAVLAPNDTMDIGPALPPPTELTAFLYLPYATVEVEGRHAAIMLCLGITASELAFIRKHDDVEILVDALKVETLVDALKAAGVYPMTDLTRSSVRLP